MKQHAVLRGFWTFLIALGLSQGCKNPPGSEPQPEPHGRASCTIDGLTFSDGATGIPDDDECNTCQCQDGHLFCTALACSPESGCRIDGKVYAAGSNDVPDPKSCNCCACEGDPVS